MLLEDLLQVGIETSSGYGDNVDDEEFRVISLYQIVSGKDNNIVVVDEMEEESELNTALPPPLVDPELAKWMLSNKEPTTEQSRKIDSKGTIYCSAFICIRIKLEGKTLIRQCYFVLALFLEWHSASTDVANSKVLKYMDEGTKSTGGNTYYFAIMEALISTSDCNII